MGTIIYMFGLPGKTAAEAAGTAQSAGDEQLHHLHGVGAVGRQKTFGAVRTTGGNFI